jgi:hypothetical protein
VGAYNPDWRCADEVTVPDSWVPGWSGTIEQEKRSFGDLEDEHPYSMTFRADPEFNPQAWEQFDAFQYSKGRFPGSVDWSLLDLFIARKELAWMPQIIGSCVQSNTFPRVVQRWMIQVALMGEPQEYLGTSEFGMHNFAPYGPYTYGIARRKANMRGGDGLYCAPMAWALMQGFLSCATPKLQELCRNLGVDGDKDFPEPQSARVYRRFGNWEFLDTLQPYADFPCVEAPQINNIDQLLAAIRAGKPAFVCSNIAIKKVGTHKDGFPIHGKDPRNNWAHNMGFDGIWVASDGEEFLREPNTSWGVNNIYNIRLSEVADWFRRGWLSCAAVGRLLAPKSAPPLVM